MLDKQIASKKFLVSPDRSMTSDARNDLENYAILGGSPMFDKPLHVNKPWAGERRKFDRYLDAAWETRRFANDGPLALELERRLEDRLGVANCVLMSNGTAAMALLLHELGISGEVILPSFTFVSTAHTLMMQGLQPVFCDVDRDSWNMSAAHCAELITDKTAAIIPTHAFGRACEVESIQAIAERAGIALVMDAAHAFDCSSNGQKIGAFGDAEVFSFHATKAFHTGEGGAVTCQDAGLAERLRLARNFGFIGHGRVNGVGTNAKMSELSAAMGLTNLDGFDASVEKNKAVYQAYVEALAGVPGISLMPFDENETNNYWYIAAQLLPEFGISRDLVMKILHAENVLARRYFFPGCHDMQPYCGMPAGTEAHLPNTEAITDTCLILPGGSEVDPQDARSICALLAGIVDNAAALAEHLRWSADQQAGSERSGSF